MRKLSNLERSDAFLEEEGQGLPSQSVVAESHKNQRGVVNDMFTSQVRRVAAVQLNLRDTSVVLVMFLSSTTETL